MPKRYLLSSGTATYRFKSDSRLWYLNGLRLKSTWRAERAAGDTDSPARRIGYRGTGTAVGYGRL
eukprot:scaffold285169_cov56-Attheya_sp.AAC.2